ncbi:MAG: DUF3459 domain-containing protein [Proteobacteria bacterium]|nr:DUF3459 domain-containing protein [Pseudomonadota bacterium]
MPHLENIGYFGNGDEAHMVYNFALPPLLLHGLRRETSRYVREWASSLGSVPAGCTFLNFTASHDGIGVRGLKGIVPDTDVDSLVEDVRKLGGRVSTRRISDGTDVPYELNISYIDALSFERDTLSPLAIRRFLTSQYLAIALRGVPAIYIQNLVGGTNDYVGLAKTERARTINRRKWNLGELEGHLRQETAGTIFAEIKRALQLRATEPNFHPETTQEVLPSSDALFIFRRSGKGGSVLVAANFTSQPQTDAAVKVRGRDLISGREMNGSLTVQPFETVWIKES